jgi:transcriptional regulator with XRE-family HTH domain
MNNTPGYSHLSTPISTKLHHVNGVPFRLVDMAQRPARAGGKLATEFGKWLVELRGGDSLQATVARMGKARISPSTLNRYETEGRVPDILTLWGLSKAFGLKFSDMAERLCRELTGGTQSAKSEASQNGTLDARLAQAKARSLLAFTVEVERVAQEMLESVSDTLREIPEEEISRARADATRRGRHR